MSPENSKLRSRTTATPSSPIDEEDDEDIYNFVLSDDAEEKDVSDELRTRQPILPT